MSLAYTIAGAADAPTVLLLHDLGGSGVMWRRQLRDLSADHYVMAPDLPGHGRSHDEPWPTLPDVVDELATVLRHRGGKAVVIGQGLGGAITLGLAAEHPELVDAAIVTGTTATRSASAWWRWLSGWAKAPLAAGASASRRRARGMRVPDAEIEDYLAAARMTSRWAYGRINGELSHASLATGVIDSSTRVLAIAGTAEHSLILRSLGEISRTFQHSETQLIPNAAPGWIIENHELFLRLVREHISPRQANASTP